MRKLPSSASAGNLRQLVDSASEVLLYSSHGSSMIAPRQRPLESSSSNPMGPTVANVSSSNVAMSEILDVSINGMDSQQTSASTTNVNMATSVNNEDRSSKKSLAYLHTKFHELLADDFGKSYERRTCNYCGAVFSFKGGTTSAALRHIKTSHPDKLVFNGSGSTTPLTPQSGQQETPDAATLDPDDGAQLTGTVEQVVSLSADTNDAASGVSSSRSALRRENSAVSLASSTASEDEFRGCLTPKRRRHGEDEQPVFSNDNSGDSYNANRAKVIKTMHTSYSKLTPSQVAILHFRHNYADELPQAAMRLRFAKHLTYNIAEAEMYNVLDPATQVEYIREFAHPRSNG